MWFFAQYRAGLYQKRLRDVMPFFEQQLAPVPPAATVRAARRHNAAVHADAGGGNTASQAAVNFVSRSRSRSLTVSG